MKRITASLASLFLLFIIFSSSLHAQWIYNFTCGTTGTNNIPTSAVVGQGLYKPVQTLPANDTSVYFRVLLVYVEFKNDNTGSETYWPYASPPVYADSLFAPVKITGSNAYPNHYISNYFNKMSVDKFDMIGDVKHIILDREYSYYSGSGDSCYRYAMLDVLRTLDTSSNSNYKADWRRYDRWRWNNSTQEFEMIDDGNIDMIYVQFRRVGLCGMTSGGYAGLYVDYNTVNFNKQIKGCDYCYSGSGVMGINGLDMPVEAAIGYFRHEFSHYTLGGHRPYSTIGGGDGLKEALGYELGFAPQDLVTLGLADVTTFNGTTNTFTLEDMQTTGDVLKVPTETTGEYFLVSNRRRISGTGRFTWDCNMGGDTAMGAPYRQSHDYSKGLYIYHVVRGQYYEPYTDLECADGLWNWSIGSSTTPDWNASQYLPTFSKTAVGYLDDDPETNLYNSSRILSRDGSSVTDYSNSVGSGYHKKWFSIGKRHTSLNTQGKERLFTNLEENWCSRENMGDRWDAWALGYNVVFSPYSSPNTKDREGNQTGIFIYYSGLSSDVATVKVYQADSGSIGEAAALAATPPSKPMLFRPITIFGCNGTYGYPRITWDNNREPDMERGGDPVYKRYKIYRAISENDTVAPLSYTYLATYDDYTPNDTANFIDSNSLNGVKILCGGEPSGYNTYFRYKISAVDNSDSESVKSDFASIKGDQITPDNLMLNNNNEAPTRYNLLQNYPNPFNPSTDIKFELPQNTYVTIKIYNTVGEEVALLVNNEWKSTGRYSVKFDGTNLASGIYFYTINAGSFRDTKKMVLIK